MKTLVFNPYSGINWDTIQKRKANLHTHTTESDGHLYAAEAISEYENADYDILVLTDHDNNRPSRSPRENGGVHYINTWPWTDFEGAEEYQAESGSLAMVEDEILGVASNGMLAFQGNEISGVNHIGSFDNDYPGEAGYTEQSALQSLKDRKGLAMIYHPGRYSRTVSQYVDWYKQFYPICRGMEVYNQGDRYPADRNRRDDILTELMPSMPIFGWSNDDMHSVEHLFTNYQHLLMREFTLAEFRLALSIGRGFFSYEPGGSGDALAPFVNSVVVNEEAGEIVIDADNADSVEWIESRTAIASGSVLQYNSANISKYVRAKLVNSNGETYTQPFGFVQGSAEKKRALPWGWVIS